MTEINRYNYEFFLSEVDDSRVPVERSQRSHDIDMFVPPRRREDRDPNEDTVRPYFDDDIQTNVSFQLTKTAYIHCTIHAVNDKVVSFVRQRDLHILTIGKYTYTTDQRFAAYHLNDTIVWTLEIRDTRRTDTGIYECQVSSDPKMSLPIQLNIIVVEATIWEGPLLYVKSGSPVNLTCHVQDPMGTVFLFWYHNGHVLDEGQKRRRQIEVVTELGITSTSRLYIAKATQEDSGNYSCQPSYSEPANITLQVLNGQKPAAVQHGRQAGLAVRASLTIIVFMNILVLI